MYSNYISSKCLFYHIFCFIIVWWLRSDIWLALLRFFIFFSVSRSTGIDCYSKVSWSWRKDYVHSTHLKCLEPFWCTSFERSLYDVQVVDREMVKSQLLRVILLHHDFLCYWLFNNSIKILFCCLEAEHQHPQNTKKVRDGLNVSVDNKGRSVVYQDFATHWCTTERPGVLIILDNCRLRWSEGGGVNPVKQKNSLVSASILN